eukprot:m.137048 g.137048  ORF g.137048 m.137048 type:complete len:213 (+) comp52489_c0_seq1:315-953(+)
MGERMMRMREWSGGPRPLFSIFVVLRRGRRCRTWWVERSSVILPSSSRSKDSIFDDRSSLQANPSFVLEIDAEVSDKAAFDAFVGAISALANSLEHDTVELDLRFPLALRLDDFMQRYAEFCKSNSFSSVVLDPTMESAINLDIRQLQVKISPTDRGLRAIVKCCPQGFCFPSSVKRVCFQKRRARGDLAIRSFFARVLSHSFHRHLPTPRP